MSRIARRLRQAGVYFVTTETWQRRTLFSKPEKADILLQQILECRDRGFYRLHAFVIMPDHLHLLITPADTVTVEKAMQMVKGGSAHRIGQEYASRFPVWQGGFHDRWVRDANEYSRLEQDIAQNPVEAKLVERPEDYYLGSASGQFPLDRSRYNGHAVRG